MRFVKKLLKTVMPCIITISIVFGYVSPAITVLADGTISAPNNIKWLEESTATATWDAVENANYYNIIVSAYDSSEALIGSESSGTTECSIDVQDTIRAIDGVSGYSSVNVRFQVQAVYQEDGVEINASEWTAESNSIIYSLVAATKYDTPTGLTFTQSDNGPVVSFNEVENADCYFIDFYKSETDTIVASEVIYYYGDEAPFSGYDSVVTISNGRFVVVVSNALAKSFANNPAYINQEMDLYCVVKVASQDQSNYIDSDYSEPSDVVSYTYSATKYDTPTGLTFTQGDNGPVVSFNEVENADCYFIDFYEAETDTIVAGDVIYYYGDEAPFSGNDSVVTISNGRFEVVVSNALAKSFANNPAYINQEMDLYCVVKVASQDQSNYIDSDYSEPSDVVSYTYSATKYDTPTGLTFTQSDNGPVVSFNEVENADCYFIDFYEAETDTIVAGDVIYYYGDEAPHSGYDSVVTISNGRFEVAVSNALAKSFASNPDYINQEMDLYCVVKVASQDQSNYIDSDYSEPSDVVSYKYQLTTAVESITVSPLTPFVPVGGSFPLGKTITPADAYYDSISWNSNNEAVVTVDSLGKLTGVVPGAAAVTATIGDVTSAPVTVTVYQLETNTDQASQEEVINTANKIINSIVEGDTTGTDISDVNTAAVLITEGMANDYEFHVDMKQEDADQDYSVEGWNEIEALYDDAVFDPIYADALDVSVELYCEDSADSKTTIGNITEFDSDIQFEIEIPDSLPEVQEGYEREYSVVRVHNGEYEVLDCTVNADNTITVESDKFSDFVLLYNDTPDDVETTVEINETNFPDSAFRQYVSLNFDLDLDGYLSDDEIARVTLISVRDDKTVRSLKGIEYFYNLEDVDCTNCGIVEIDVSQNLNLKSLMCSGNYLTELDVSKNSNLILLECMSNRLIELDVSTCGSLKGLHCDENCLTELDISSNSNLTYLSCRYNQITQLTVPSNLGGLSSERIVQKQPNSNFGGWYTDEDCTLAFDFSEEITSVTTLYAKWTTLEIVSYNFPDEVFRQYIITNCDKNGDGILSDDEIKKVTSINLSSAGVQDLQGIGSFSELQQLNCDSNQLTELDISKNTKLIQLNCSQNQLSQLDLSNNPKLYSLNCSNNQITQLDVSNNPELYSLNCSDNQITQLDVSNKTHLKYCYCSNNLLTEIVITSCTDLYVLNCSNNQLTELNISGYEKLYSLICSNNQLTELTLSDCNPYHLFCDNNQLTSLDISGIGVRVLDCSSNKLTLLDVSNTDLESLKCFDNNLTQLDLSKQIGLSYLDCSNNQLSSLLLPEYEDYYTPELYTVNCSNNMLTTLDISEDTALSHLWCANNNIDSIDIRSSEALVNAFKNESICFAQELDGNPVIWVDEDTEIVCTYNVTFDPNGKEADTYIQAVIVGNAAIRPEDPVSEGYIFAGWYTNPTCTNQYYFHKPVTTDITLYAKWTKDTRLTVTFDANGHGTAPNIQKVYSLGRAVQPDDPIAPGYVFGGWYKDPECTEVFYFDSMIVRDTTLYAKWIKVHTISFENNGYGTFAETQNVNEGSKVIMPLEPQASGYSFVGWYTDSACTQEYDFNTTVCSSFTLYAKWIPSFTAGWNEYDGKYYYADKNGELVYNTWITEGNKKYYVGSDGARVTGRQTIDGEFYYFKTDGRMATGLKKLGSSTYYFDPATGKAVTGWQTIDGNKYYFKSNGKMQTGWKTTSGGTSYYLDTDGKMVTGMKEIEGKSYYFASNGKMQTGLMTIGQYLYYFDADGVMQTGRQKIDGEFYYFKTNGRASTGWKTLGSYTYYFDPVTCKAVTGWQMIDGSRYYFKSNGKMQTGWKETSGGTKYYFDTDGKMVTGWKTIDGVQYYFNSNGKLSN